MGISLSVYSISDVEIKSLAEDPARLIEFTRSSADACFLADFWDGIHFLMTDGLKNQSLPCGAIKVGDVTFRKGSEPAHAILSDTAREFAREIARLTDATLRKRFDMDAMVKAKIYPGRTWLFSEYSEQSYQETMFYFGRLRQVAKLASDGGKGLLFERYEDL